jgi:hypothetical protein
MVSIYTYIYYSLSLFRKERLRACERTSEENINNLKSQTQNRTDHVLKSPHVDDEEDIHNTNIRSA